MSLGINKERACETDGCSVFLWGVVISVSSSSRLLGQNTFVDTKSSSVQCGGYKLSLLDGCPILAWVRLFILEVY